MKGHRRRFLAPTSSPTPSPSIGDLRVRFSRIVSHHEQLKLAFNQLDFQIRTGLQEAADVFESLANPLMKLVGLKTVEMAEEGKFSTVVVDYNHFFADDFKRNENGAETMVRNEASEIEEEGYINRAKTVGKELIQKQEMQLKHLIHLLRQVEAQVNSSQTNILQTLSDHQTSIHNVFKKAVAYVSAIHQRGEHDSTSVITIQLLKHIFRLIVSTLSSVESGVDNLVDELARKMCSPMVDYVKGLKLEIRSGRCHHLLSIVEEMGGAMRTGRIELEEVRKKARVAEHNRLDALYKLKKLEEMARKHQFLLEAKNGSKEQFEHEKDHAKEDNLLWELLKKKRKLCMGNGSSKPCGLALSQLSPQTPCLVPSSSPTYSSNGHHLLPKIPLGSSPSVTYPQRKPQKKITSGFRT
ncbi:uncharacterized protein LOC107806689 isoform X2 [Nicotiana tabacum]|uniref:Uncharacterized protein LOC107806689 isoform X2 n=2 Tax=Nicotiana tabacum TaxID=4097 RepID=A0AC58SQT0_TOBAC|nr:PREDICTED: uncharacterized protein LOC107806689 isoform X2 [Nicotiana tabacum]